MMATKKKQRLVSIWDQPGTPLCGKINVTVDIPAERKEEFLNEIRKRLPGVEIEVTPHRRRVPVRERKPRKREIS